jgi:outer membrane lipoprotein-sorting protein
MQVHVPNLPHGLLITLCCCVFLLISSGQAADDGRLRLQSIQADFIQEKHLKILVRPLVSTGTLTFQAPQSLRWEYHTPVPSILLLHGGKVRKFIRRDGQLVEDKGMGLDTMQVVLDQISSWLDGRFTDNEMFRVSFADDRTVLLTPKQQALVAVISNIELQLADRKGLLDAVTIYEGPESYTRMTFSNRVLNKQLPATVFTVK